MNPLMSTGNRLHESLVDHSCARKCSGIAGKRKNRGEKEMGEYLTSMDFLEKAGGVCLLAAAAAFLIALVMFFMFDIRTIFLIRTGLARQAVLLSGAKTEIKKDEKKDDRKKTEVRIVRRIIVTDTDEIIPLRHCAEKNN
jgi:hypothetical protein